MVNGTKNQFINAGKSERLATNNMYTLCSHEATDYFADNPMLTLSILTSGGFATVSRRIKTILIGCEATETTGGRCLFRTDEVSSC